MTNIKKHFAITMLTSVGVVLVNFVTGVLVARTLNPSGRGEIASIGTWSQILGWACSFGFSESLVYLQSSRPDASKRLVGTSLASVLLFGTIGVIVSELVIPLAFKHQSRDTVHLAKMYMVTIYLGVLGNMLNGLVKGHQNFNFANFLRLFQPALYVVGILVFWFFHFLTPATTLTASAISGGVSAFLTLGSLLKSNCIGLPSLSRF